MRHSRILIVEDDGDVASGIEETLKGLGFCGPVTAARGEHALRTAEEIHPDLALVDVGPPGARDGMQLACSLRERLGVPVMCLAAGAAPARAGSTMAIESVPEAAPIPEHGPLCPALLRCIQDAVIATDEQGFITFMSPAAEEITGRRAREACGQSLCMVLKPRDPATRQGVEWPAGLIGAADAPALQPRRFLIEAAGREALVEIRCEAAGGGIVLAFRDITGTEQLRDSEEHYRSLVENANDIIFVTNLDGCVEFANRAAEHLFGYSPSELSGMTIFDLIAPEFHDLARRVVATALGGENFGTHELDVLTRKGARATLEMSTRVRFRNGTPCGIEAIARDTTARREAAQLLARQAEELARSNAELEQFAYIASHDLQEPLRIVSGFAGLLASRYKNRLDTDGCEFIDYIMQASSRMQQLIKALLTYSRVSRTSHELRRTDSEAVLAIVLKNLEKRSEETCAVITHDLLPVVIADELQLGQLLQNLISNAIKFHGEAPPRIHISVRREASEWIFSVRDNGIGLAAEDLERVFVMFERIHSENEYSGTGIGLAICKRIVERHKGRIWVDSEPGKGSVFSFAIPAGGGEQGETIQ